MRGSGQWIDTKNEPAENFAREAARVLQNAAPDAVIGVSSPGTRAVMGLASVGLGAAVVSNVNKVSVNSGTLQVEHSILGDKMIETLEMPNHACLLVSLFSLPPQEPSTAAMPERIEKISADGSGTLKYLSVEPAASSRLLTADRVIGVGLGAAGGVLFEQTKQLAQILGAEMGCSMPIYNELQLMPHESYIGITGVKIAPELYLALGISGTSQHYAGVRNAKTIVCVNKDPKALFFDNADYGIVGDLNEVLPELISALK